VPAAAALAGNGSAGPSDYSDDAVNWNQEFFGRMDQDYEAMCASDGWEDIRRDQEEMMKELKRRSPEEQIPVDSDYFKVHIPPEAMHRELRATDLSAEAAAAYRLPPQKPRRNFDELRRVEAETREAIEREKAKIAAAKESAARKAADVDNGDGDLRPTPTTASSERSYVRTRSDTVKIDTLESSEDETEAATPEQVEQARMTMDALKEFERLGREKDERLKQWRDRWGS